MQRRPRVFYCARRLIKTRVDFDSAVTPRSSAMRARYGRAGGLDARATSSQTMTLRRFCTETIGRMDENLKKSSPPRLRCAQQSHAPKVSRRYVFIMRTALLLVVRRRAYTRAPVAFGRVRRRVKVERVIILLSTRLGSVRVYHATVVVTNNVRIQYTDR